MTVMLNKLLFRRCTYFLSKSNKSVVCYYSKWANIKDIKEEKDNERMVLFRHLTQQMEIAIRANGGNTKPSHNLKLAQIIEQAKAAKMPVASINSFLEKMEARKNKTQAGVAEVRGPNGYVMIVRYTTDNPKAFICLLKSKLKKTSGRISEDSAKKMFDHIGNIIVEKKDDLEHAMENAINIGAEDVEEFEENNTKYFLFKCDPKLLNKIQNLLQGLQYCVLSAEENYIPHNVIELIDSDLEAVAHIRRRVLDLEDVNHIYDNL